EQKTESGVFPGQPATAGSATGVLSQETQPTAASPGINMAPAVVGPPAVGPTPGKEIAAKPDTETVSQPKEGGGMRRLVTDALRLLLGGGPEDLLGLDKEKEEERKRRSAKMMEQRQQREKQENTRRKNLD
ncbi:MAG: hypothetical protein V2B18_04740, partial [Pseudomonadota bacterium]